MKGGKEMGKRITVTGPRSHKLYGKDMNNTNNLNYIKFIILYLSQHDEIDEINIGMSTGVDLLFGLAAIYHAKNHTLKIHCYIPGVNQTKNYSEKEIEIYNHLLEHADQVYQLTEEPCTPKVLKNRNRKMVKESDEILSFWDFKKYKSGTWSTINYAQKKKKSVYNINPFDLQIQGYL